MSQNKMRQYDVEYLYCQFKNEIRRREAAHPRSALNKAFRRGYGWTWEECGESGPTDMDIGIGARVMDVETGKISLFYLYEWG